jgi:hypothetical protein
VSIRIYVHNDGEDRAATIDEIERMFLNCHNEGTGLADLDYKAPNGVAKEPASVGFTVTVIKGN